MTVEADITLVATTYGKDIYGVDRKSETERTVLCEVRSATRSEFYQAAQAGMKPELEVSLFFADYQNEPLAKYNDQMYTVVRSYRGEDDERIILTLERKTGNRQKATL